MDFCAQLVGYANVGDCRVTYVSIEEEGGFVAATVYYLAGSNIETRMAPEILANKLATQASTLFDEAFVRTYGLPVDVAYTVHISYPLLPPPPGPLHPEPPMPPATPQPVESMTPTHPPENPVNGAVGVKPPMQECSLVPNLQRSASQCPSASEISNETCRTR